MAVRVPVLVLTDVLVTVGVRVAVAVIEAVASPVAVHVAVAVAVAVAVPVRVAVAVAVAVFGMMIGRTAGVAMQTIPIPCAVIGWPGRGTCGSQASHGSASSALAGSATTVPY